MDNEKDQVREVVISTSEKNLRLMSRYLSYVVICGLSYWVIHLDMQLQKLTELRDKEKQEGLVYWRDAYRKSWEAYLRTIENKQQNEKHNYSEE